MIVLSGLVLLVGAVGALSALMLRSPDSSPANLPPDEDESRLRAAYQAIEQTGLALESFKEREGNWPESLAELRPADLEALPEDPFARDRGVPLRYVSSGASDRGRVLYSVGPDRRDQGGAPLDPIAGRGDLTYPVW